MKQLLITIAALVLVWCGELTIHDGTFDVNIDAFKKHLAAGADVKARNDGGFTPLHYAAMDNRKEVAELLIDKGEDVNAKDVDGTTPLDLAIKRKRTETADLLRKHGVKTG